LNPRLLNPPLSIPKKNRPGVMGHRGARATHPENTLAAFEHALQCGADAVELDVVVTVDGVLAVTHDPVMRPFAELPSGVPDLDRVLAAGAGNDLIFDIEAKECGALTPTPHAYAQMILDAVDRAGMAERVFLRSFDHSILRAAHDLRPEIPLVALVADRALNWVRICERAKARCISPWFKLVSKAAVRRAHEAGLVVMPWTVNKPRSWARMVRLGVDWIITDDPAALVEYLHSRAEAD
jgi:glycerophosphoryl diester phosphodiesterase